MAQITPIGGSAQIGSNLIHVKSAKSSFVIDCGLLFPYEDFFDINYLIPDFYNLDPTPTHLILTHGHEDHIGAIVEFVRAYPTIEIWTSAFTRELILRKLGFAGDAANIKVYQADVTEIEVDDFRIRPLHVNHSIPETHGLFIYHKGHDYCFFYVSDFKIDPLAINEKPCDLKLLGEWAKPFKRRILAADSTNILSSRQKTLSESDVKIGLEKAISEAPARVFVTLFSSNVHRIQNIVDICRKTNRKLMTVGRSVENYMQAGMATGHLDDVSDVLRTPESYDKNSDKLLILTSGCQGEFKSGLKRISQGTDPNFKPREGDTVIFSSKAIPGNEKKVALMMNDLVFAGAKIFMESKDYPVHASGHAGPEDLVMLYDAFKPNFFFPTHGETLFLEEHKEFFHELHKDCQVLRPLNFDNIVIEKEKVSLNQNEAKNPILIHGSHHVIEREAISERRKLATQGLMSVILTLKGKSLKNVQVEIMGLPRMIKKDEVEKKARELFSNNASDVSESMRVALRRYYGELLGYRPIVLVQIALS